MLSKPWPLRYPGTTMTAPPLSQIEVIAPNLKRRLSGVTATVVRLIPIQARQIGIVTTGPGLPPTLPHISLASLLFLPRDHWRVWHARRNTEMALGLILRHILRRKLRLMFTSASQRRHSAYTRFLIRQMEDVVATSSRTAAYLERPCHVIMHGIDTQTFAPALDRPALRVRLGLPPGVLIGCYGRIRERKGTDVFVRSMIATLPRFPNVTAVVMGRATEGHVGFFNALKAEVAAAGLANQILFAPEVPVSDMADWYGALDLYVAPQRWEGFGLTPLEAMSCGVPILATRVGAFEDIVTPEVGSLIPPGDLDAMAKAVAHWLSRPADLVTAGTAARNVSLTRHRIEVEASALVALYRQLLARP